MLQPWMTHLQDGAPPKLNTSTRPSTAPSPLPAPAPRNPSTPRLVPSGPAPLHDRLPPRRWLVDPDGRHACAGAAACGRRRPLRPERRRGGGLVLLHRLRARHHQRGPHLHLVGQRPLQRAVRQLQGELCVWGGGGVKSPLPGGGGVPYTAFPQVEGDILLGGRARVGREGGWVGVCALVLEGVGICRQLHAAMTARAHRPTCPPPWAARHSTNTRSPSPFPSSSMGGGITHIFQASSRPARRPPPLAALLPTPACRAGPRHLRAY